MKTVMHKSLVIHRGDTTITTTLCRRVRRGDEMNVAGDNEVVTCKLCLRRMASIALRAFHKKQ